MARNGFNEAARRNAAGVEAVEGLLAYAQTQARGTFGRGAAKSAREAVMISRQLAARDPVEFIPLLSRSLCVHARLLRRRPAEALPMAEEAVMLTRSVRGGPLVLALSCLADILTALGRPDEAAAALAEADKAARE